MNGAANYYKEQISQIAWRVGSGGALSLPNDCNTTTTTTTAPPTTTTTTTAPVSTTTTTTTLILFTFLPEDPNLTYLASRIYDPIADVTYIYGNFTGYKDAGVDNFDTVRLIKLDTDLHVPGGFDTGTGFNSDTDLFSQILIHPADGKLIVTGAFSSYNGSGISGIAKIDVDGTVDGPFNAGGTGFGGFPGKMDIGYDGTILVPGSFGSYNGNAYQNLIAIDPSSGLPTSAVFGVLDGVTFSISASRTFGDTYMIVTGSFDSYYSNFGYGGINKIDYITGFSDSSFNSGGDGFAPLAAGTPNFVVRLNEDTDGSIYVAGSFTTYNGVSEPRIIKLDSLGAKVAAAVFDAGGGFNQAVTNIEVIWDNRLFIEGQFSNYNGTACYGLVILNSDGTILYAAPVPYYTPFTVGDNVYGRTDDEGLHIIFTKP